MKYNANRDNYYSGNPIRQWANTFFSVQLLSILSFVHYDICLFWFCLCAIFNFHRFFSPITSGKCTSYIANFKLQMIAFAKSSNNSMAACHFSVNNKQLDTRDKSACILWLFLMYVLCKKCVLLCKPTPLLWLEKNFQTFSAYTWKYMVFFFTLHFNKIYFYATIHNEILFSMYCSWISY